MKTYSDIVNESPMPGMPGTSSHINRPEAPAPPKPAPKASESGSSKPLTSQELNSLEKHLNGIWEHLGIKFDFTKHFFERVNDPRNKKQITIGELQKIFTDVYNKYGQMIASKVKPDTEKTFDSVLTDMSTKVNSPVIVEWDKSAKKLVMRAKTVMRVDPFYTHPDQKRLTVQHYEPENTMKSKTYTDLKEWLGFNTPEVAPIAAPQAVDDVDSAAFSVEEPAILDKLNAYCHEIANHQYLNPYYPLNALWKKLSMVGINFNLKGVMLTGDSGRTMVPLNRFGGRYGTLGGPEYISHDDGTGVPAGLNLVVTWVKTGGVYSLTVQIEHGASALPFGEEVVAEGVDSYGEINGKPEKFDKKFANTHARLVHHGFNTKGTDSNGVTVYNHKTKGNIMIGSGSNPRWSHVSGKGLNSQGYATGKGHASLKKHLETNVKPDYEARRKNLMKVHEDEEVKKK